MFLSGNQKKKPNKLKSDKRRLQYNEKQLLYLHLLRPYHTISFCILSSQCSTGEQRLLSNKWSKWNTDEPTLEYKLGLSEWWHSDVLLIIESLILKSIYKHVSTTEKHNSWPTVGNKFISILCHVHKESIYSLQTTDQVHEAGDLLHRVKNYSLHFNPPLSPGFLCL